MQTKIALITSQDIGFQLVEALSLRQDLSLLVVTDRTARDALYGYRSAADACQTRNIPHIVTPRFDAATVRALETFAPDAVVSAYYPHLIPDAVIRLGRKAAVNLHPGLLPFYRGKFPTPWYILNGEKEFGLAIHKIDSGIDTGDVFVQRRFPLPPAITGHELYRLTMDLGAKLLAESLDGIVDGSLKAVAQTGAGSYYSRIEKSFEIDFNLSWQTIERRVRVHAKPYMPAYTKLMNCMVFFNRVRPAPLDSAQGGGKITKVLDDGTFIVSCSDGALLVEDFDVYPSGRDNGSKWPFQLKEGMKFE